MIIECTNPKEIAFSYKEICNPTLLEYAKNKPPLQGILKIDELEQSFSFEVTGFLGISVFNKTFFALTVFSPGLKQLRLKYNLPTKLNYRGLLVPFHITIATSVQSIGRKNDEDDDKFFINPGSSLNAPRSSL